jgi:hypothetical protein
MAQKRDFSPTEWNSLRDTPYVVCIAVLLAGSTGFATVTQLLDFALRIVTDQNADTVLARELTSKSEMQNAEVSVKQSLRVARGTPSSDSIRRRALEQARTCAAIAVAKTNESEARSYRKMLFDIAEKTALTARNERFVGFQLEATEAERLFLTQLRQILEIELVKRA